MKATDYLSKYENDMVNVKTEESYKQITLNVLSNLIEELKEIIKQRNCQRNEAVVAVIKEINQRFNKFIDLFYKKYGFTPFAKDGFKKFAFNRYGVIE